VKARFLPILNAIGCLALTALVITQWGKERKRAHETEKLRIQLFASSENLAEANRRNAALERDITALKESIAAIQQSAEAATRTLAEESGKTGTLETELTAAREQIKTWEAAIAERDAKLRELNSDLTASRARLNEAIAKLKAAAQ
jgi:chromosome segregation ATPase